VELVDGSYNGIWGGYIVTIMGNGYTFETENGVKGINIPVAVEVKDGEAKVIS
jgi:hypothetical protein